tara:strand:- start:12040 stop:12984 length:945 start_codon:yes stop_codon:yes gene_type:complete
MKILYVDPVVQTGTSSNYKYYDGVYDQLARDHSVMLHRGVPHNIEHLITQSNFSPDVIIFGLGWFNHKYFGRLSGMSIPSICVLFKPQNELKEKLNFCKINKIDQILTPVPGTKKIEKVTGIKTKLFPYGFDQSVFFDRKMEKEYDIGFSGALHENKHYPTGAFPVENIRTKIGDILTKNDKIKVFWSSSDSRPARIPSYEEYSKTINKSKIWIATQAAFGDITPRYYEVAATGTLLFCQKIPSEYRDIFKDGVNCVEFSNDLTDFNDKLSFYLNNDKDRRTIVENAKTFFHDNCRWSHRADELVATIRGMLDR